MNFDYVIVGGGIAGTVLASRLSEQPDCTVLLLEEGDNPLLGRLCGGYEAPGNSLLGHPVVDGYWQAESMPEEQLANRPLTFRRGRTLGGQSLFQPPVYMRGQKNDYERWALPGWLPEEIWHHFMKMERCLEGGSDIRGGIGRLRMGQPLNPTPLERVFLQGCMDLGFERNADLNGISEEGVGVLDQMGKGRRTRSVLRDYLPIWVRQRRNLKILTAARVEKLIIKDNRIKDVYFHRHRKGDFKVRVHRELFLCAGPILTPQMLMLAGIGPGDVLKKQGVKVRKNVEAVGQNLQAHIECRLRVSSLREVMPFKLDKRHRRRFLARLLWMVSQKGPFSQSFASVGGLVRSDEKALVPDLRLGIFPSIYKGRVKTEPLFPAFVLSAGPAQPASSGVVSLQGRNFKSPPSVHFNLLSEKSDTDLLGRGLKIMRDLARSESFLGWTRQDDSKKLYAGEGKGENDMAFIAEHLFLTGDFCGTCRMGKDEESVLDERGRLRGFSGIRIADSSAMPFLPSGALTGPLVMMAERLAEMALEDNREEARA